MSKLQLPKFESYEEEAAFWDTLDTADAMEDDDEWFRFETDSKRALQIAISPQVALALAERAHAQGVTIETLVNGFLMERLYGAGAALK